MRIWRILRIVVVLIQWFGLRAIAQTGGGLINLPAETLGPSSRRTGIAISEIMYKPAPRSDGKVLEFVELYNSNPFYEDISGYRLTGQIDFTFPPNTIMSGTSFVVVASAPLDIQSLYGLTNVFGPYTNSLKTQSGSALLQLIDPIGSVLLEVPYSKNAPWPVAAAGTGHSLVLARPSYGEGDPKAWVVSDVAGGSPGRSETNSPNPLRSVVINEFLADPIVPSSGYIELYNHSNQPVEVSGCILTDQPNTNRFAVPASTTIPADGFISFDENELGFQLNAAGGTIYFKTPDAASVLDTVQYEAQEQNVSTGRFPDGSDDFYPFSTVTPGSSNSRMLVRDIVINEIMYKPISGDENDSYVELYNKGSNSVNIGGWSFISGISYTFPTNTTIGADGYLVVGKNVTNLFAHYSNLNAANTLGDFSSKLSGNGERIALGRPESKIITNASGGRGTNIVWIVVDEVTYSSGGRWGQWSSGGGSSLELTDPKSDHRLAYNWADSDETGKSAWTNIEATGVLDLGGNYESGIVHIQIGLLDVGECLVDNVEVHPGAQAVDYVSNGGFESALTGWTLQGDHVRSSLEAEGFQSAHSLHLRCSDRIWTGANSVQGTLTNTTLAAGQTATLRFKARWLHGWPEALLRLNGNWLEATGALPVPANLGTPGMRNSRAIPNAGPAISQVIHSPALPAANQSVLVTARVDDPDGVQTVSLNYRIDPATTFTSMVMLDDGTGGDLVAGDGLYSATIPGNAASTMVAFNIQTSDSKSATSRFPSLLADNSPTRECLIRFGDANPVNAFGTYHLWLSQQTITRWSALPDLSNEMFDGTFVYGNRVIYNMAARYAGSPYHQQFDSPIGSLCHYKWSFPDDDKLLGVTSFNKIHQPGNGPGDDDSIQREQTAYWMARQIGLPWNYRRYVAVYVNGKRRGTLMEDAQTPDSERVKEQFPDDADGFLYKLQPWFEFAANGSSFNNNSWCTLNNYTTGGQKKLARYRWNYLSRRSPDSANNYTNVFALIDAANSYQSPSFVSNMENLVDMEEWMRIFAIEHAVGNWDSFGAQNAQNMYGYKPLNGKWTLFIWDYNIVLGDGSWGPDGGNLFFYNGADPVMGRIYANPAFRRAYLRAFKDIANGPMSSAKANPVLDAKYAAFRTNGVTVASPSAIKSWISTMHNSLLATLANEGANAAFSVINNNGSDFATNKNYLAITGTAPVEVKTISINGVPYPVTWTSVAGWTIWYSLEDGTNSLEIVGFDLQGNQVPNATKTIHVTYTGQQLDSPEGNILINEIMYNSPIPGANYIELFNNSQSTAFDLSGWQLKGVGFTFEDGTILAPGGFLLVVEDRVTFDTTYGANLPIAGEWTGKLNPTGETLELIKPGGIAATDLSIAKVKFESSAPWPSAANGMGSSLQLIDPNQSNDRVANWSTISTNSASQTPEWQYVTLTGIATKSILLIGVVTPGDVYIDDLKLVAGSLPEAGLNYLQNGDFESPLDSPWTVSPNMVNSSISTSVKHSGKSSLHVVATSGGPTIGDAIWQNTVTLTTNATYTLSYWYLPSSNGTSLLIRLSGSMPNSGHVYSLQPFQTPPPSSTLYTPGAVNSVSAVLPAISPLYLNEIEPNNLTGLQDRSGARSPWVELYNPSSNAVSLTNLFLSDNYTNLTRWAFPSNALISAGGFPLVWLDANPSQITADEFHASFRIPEDSGSIALVQLINNEPRVIDYFNYDNMSADQAFGSFPDGSVEDRRLLAHPSPGLRNDSNTLVVTLYINEWMAGNTKTIADPADGLFSDWFELYNAGSVAVDLAGFYLSNSATNKTQFRIPNGKTITAGGYLLVWADSKTALNTNSADLHVNFKLAKSGESIALFAPNGLLIDNVSFGAQTDDVSQGRTPDGGSGPFESFTQATPGSSNDGSVLPADIVVTGSLEPEGVVLKWNSGVGDFYQVQFKESLSEPDWQALPPITATSYTTSITNQVTPSTVRFFRIQRLNQ